MNELISILMMSNPYCYIFRGHVVFLVPAFLSALSFSDVMLGEHDSSFLAPTEKRGARVSLPN